MFERRPGKYECVRVRKSKSKCVKKRLNNRCVREATSYLDGCEGGDDGG